MKNSCKSYRIFQCLLFELICVVFICLSVMGKKILLVIGGNPKIDWYKVFEKETVNGDEITVEMAMWDEVCQNISFSSLVIIFVDIVSKLFGLWISVGRSSFRTSDSRIAIETSYSSTTFHSCA